MKKLGVIFLCLSFQVVAQESEDYKTIYPFVPMSTEVIKSRTIKLTENNDVVDNIYQINKLNLERGSTKTRPWGSSYWPLYQGGIANNYQDKNYNIFITELDQMFSWEVNLTRYKRRVKRVHSKVLDLSERDLAKLAPSEKYDLLLGDMSFDLTNRIWQHMETWGNEKRWGFLTSIETPAGYEIPEANRLMAFWEGICHGWATSSGLIPRPQKTVWVTLPNGKKMPFYPTDTKALISLLWANSVVQDTVIMEGYRCNEKRPHKDEFGRFIDKKRKRANNINTDTEPLPRCADVHPAVFHTSVVNLTGIQRRSFIVDINAKAAITNQPVESYKYNYFNPISGKDELFQKSIVAVEDYKDDPFRDARNPSTRFIVGVSMDLNYVDWQFPKKVEFDTEKNDKIGKLSFNYDLELDKNGDIIGGQWRVRKDGKPVFTKMKNTNQPDFFWVVPKDWKRHFNPIDLPEWDIRSGKMAPASWVSTAKSAHSFIYNMTKEFGSNLKCKVYPTRDVQGEPVEVPCEFKVPQPQPLLQVVNQLIDLSH